MKWQLHILDIKIKRFTYQESDYKLLVSTAFLIGLQYNLLNLNWDLTELTDRFTDTGYLHNVFNLISYQWKPSGNSE